MNSVNTVHSGLARPKILVLGGTGRLIVAEALARGFEVRVLVRLSAKAGGLEGPEVFIGDARDEAALRNALEGRDAARPFAGATSSSGGQKS